MALPTLERTWQFNVNQVCSGTPDLGAVNKEVVLAYKNSMIGFALNPWVVKGSCNSVTYGMDGVDRLLTPADVVWATNQTIGIKSWIVLKNNVTGQEILFACISGSSTNNSRAYVSSSPGAGFTGGTTIAPPTATDEIVHLPRSGFMYDTLSSTAPVTHILHMWHSTDGQATRWAIFANGILINGGMWEVAGDPVSTWSGLVSEWHQGSSTANGTVFTIGTWSGQDRLRTRIGSTDVAFRCLIVANSTAIFLNNGVPNEISGEWDLVPVLLNCQTTGFRGIHGRLKDLWWGNESPAIPMGTTYPSDGSRQMIQFGSFVFPWDGSIPLIA